jgi:hypothetical protein
MVTMPCDFCGHTVQNIGNEHRRIFWCPRCGSLKDGRLSNTESADFSETTVPQLADQIRAANDMAMRLPKAGRIHGWIISHIRWMGIREAVGRDPHAGEND